MSSSNEEKKSIKGSGEYAHEIGQEGDLLDDLIGGIVATLFGRSPTRPEPGPVRADSSTKPAKSPIDNNPEEQTYQPQQDDYRFFTPNERQQRVVSMGEGLLRSFNSGSLPSFSGDIMQVLNRITQSNPMLLNKGEPLKSRYERWLQHKESLEQEMKNFQEQEKTFLLRWDDPSRERPSTDEIRVYERDRAINANRQRELTAMADKAADSFALGTIPTTEAEAVAILKRLAPSNSIFIRPKELRDAVPLLAPGGVVDEVEVNKDVIMIQERMLKAKKRALEGRKPEEQKKGGGGRSRKRKAKNVKSTAKGAAQVVEGAQKAEENKADKVETNPLEEVWYSTLIFPQLAKELVAVSKELVENLGAEGALAALNTALMEEALAIDKACDYIGTLRYKLMTNPGPPGSGLLRLKSLEEEQIALGDSTAAARLSRNLHNFEGKGNISQQILNGVIEAGFADAWLYESFGDLNFFSRKAPGTSGILADKYYRLASEFQPTKLGEAEKVLDAQIGRIRLYTLGRHPISPDPVYAAYLMSKLHTTRDNTEPLTLARMYRFELWRPFRVDEAVRYYRAVLREDIRPYDPAVLQEARDFIVTIAVHGENPSMILDEQTALRLKYLLASVKLHPDIPDIYSFIANHYMDEDSNMKKAKEYLDKGIKYLSPNDPSAGARLLSSLANYHLDVGELTKGRTYLEQAEAVLDSVPVDVRLEINKVALSAYRAILKDSRMALKAVDRLIKDGSFEHITEKGLLLLFPFDKSMRRDLYGSYQCFLEAEKYLSRNPGVSDRYLAKAYYYLGLFHLPTAPPSSASKKKKAKTSLPPEDREKARYYFQKCVDLGETRGWKRLAMTYFSKKYPWKEGKDDEAKAAECYIKAIELGEGGPDEYEELSYLYMSGRGVKKDIVKGTAYYKLAHGTNEEPPGHGS